MIYKKFLNGVDMFGKSFYHAIIDECVPHNKQLSDYLINKGYSILVINDKPLKGIPDELISKIALLNNSVIITSDKEFSNKLYSFNSKMGLLVYNIIYYNKKKKTPWINIAKSIDKLIISKAIMNNLEVINELINNLTIKDLSKIIKNNKLNNIIKLRNKEYDNIVDLIQQSNFNIITPFIKRGVYEFNNPNELIILKKLNVPFKEL